MKLNTLVGFLLGIRDCLRQFTVYKNTGKSLLFHNLSDIEIMFIMISSQILLNTNDMNTLVQWC